MVRTVNNDGGGDWAGTVHHLATDEEHNARDDCLPLSKEQASRDLHAHGHEEEPHQQTLVGRNVALHLQRKLSLCHQQTSLQHGRQVCMFAQCWQDVKADSAAFHH